MTKERKQYWLAVSSLVGTIIGVGIFGVPYAIRQAGWPAAALLFVVLTGIQLLQHLFYAEAAIASDDQVRLVGLAERYLGKGAKRVVAVAEILGFWAAMLAYVIVGGNFLHALLGPWLGGSAFIYQLAWGAVGALVIWFGLGFVARIGFIATVALVIALLMIFGWSLPAAHLANFAWAAPAELIMPYGVILFSLSGLSAIPEMEDMLEQRHRNFRRSIVVGTLTAAMLTAAFGFAVYAATGGATTPDAVGGLESVLGRGIAELAAAFGFLAIATSYFTTAINLRETFEYDYRLKRLTAWLLATVVPVGVFLVANQSFTAIISFSGAVFGGITAIAVALLYLAVRRRKAVEAHGATHGDRPLGLAPAWAYASIAVLAVGAAYEVVTTATKLF